jgi:hypothetical protein
VVADGSICRVSWRWCERRAKVEASDKPALERRSSNGPSSLSMVGTASGCSDLFSPLFSSVDCTFDLPVGEEREGRSLEGK